MKKKLLSKNSMIVNLKTIKDKHNYVIIMTLSWI